MNPFLDLIRKGSTYLVAQAPAAAAVYSFWPQAKTRPVLAIGLVLLYEVALWLLGTVRRIWEEELRAEVQKTTAAGIRSILSFCMNTIRGMSPGFRRKLCRALQQEYGIFNDRGLGLINANRLDLRSVFVELRIASSPKPATANADPIAAFELPGSQTIWSFLRSLKQEAVALAIIGAPGAGKTTLLLHVLLTFATNTQWRRLMRAKIPVLLYLREHLDTICSGDPEALSQMIENHISKHLGKLRTPKGWFEPRLVSGKCIVFFDGLDEVPDETQRQLVSRWIDQQIRDYPKTRFLITARPHGYRSAPLQRANVLELQPFSQSQVKAFTHQWYLANEITSSGRKKGAAVRARARKDADDLLRRLARTPSLNALTVNPLLLTMIAMVHRYHGALPGSRAQLYAEICQVLLERWRAGKGVTDSLRGDQKLAVLRPLAAYMMAHELRDVGAQEAMSIVTPILEKVGLPIKHHATFLNSLQGSSGLLLEREDGMWGFAHLSFQEYLTATHWLAGGPKPSDWTTLVTKSWWFETIRLYAAQADASPIVTACLANPDVTTLALAWDCLDDARELSKETRSLAKDVLHKALERPGSDAWPLAARTLLLRRQAANFSPLTDNAEIAITLISNAEYQLFSDEVRAGGRAPIPDGWAAPTFTPGAALEPVRGVRLRNAIRFCNWLSNASGGLWHYRLPTPREAASVPATAIGAHTFWTLDPVPGKPWPHPLPPAASLSGQVHPSEVKLWPRSGDIPFPLLLESLRTADLPERIRTNSRLSAPDDVISYFAAQTLEGATAAEFAAIVRNLQTFLQPHSRLEPLLHSDSDARLLTDLDQLQIGIQDNLATTAQRIAAEQGDAFHLYQEAAAYTVLLFECFAFRLDVALYGALGTRYTGLLIALASEILFGNRVAILERLRPALFTSSPIEPAQLASLFADILAILVAVGPNRTGQWWVNKQIYRMQHVARTRQSWWLALWHTLAPWRNRPTGLPKEAASLHWCLRLLMLRLQKKLPTNEGILLVRERSIP